jgi:hypothetical protein
MTSHGLILDHPPGHKRRMIKLSRTIPNAQKPLCSTPRLFGTSTFGTIVLSLRSHHRPRHYPILGRSHGAWCSTLQGRSRGGSVLPRRMTTTSQEPLRFPVTPYPTEAELARREPVRTAGCVVIGDEILNGKTRDSNAHFLAQQAFRLGIRLATIVVVPDEENAIVQAVRTLCRPDSGVDIVFTSGGIGPTHGRSSIRPFLIFFFLTQPGHLTEMLSVGWLGKCRRHYVPIVSEGV